MAILINKNGLSPFHGKIKCGFADFEQKSCRFTPICINIFVYMIRPTQIRLFLTNLETFPLFSCFLRQIGPGVFELRSEIITHRHCMF